MNRYHYAGNNPVNNIDPDGHGFFRSLFNAIRDTIRFVLDPRNTNPQLRGLTTGDWSYARDMAIAGATGFVFGGPVGAAAAMATTAYMRTPIAQFQVETLSHQYYDDVLGMSPRTAHIWASVAVSTTASLGFERTFANMVANPATVRNTALTDKEIEKLRNSGQYVGDENVFGPSLKTKGAFERDNVKGLMQDGKLVGSFQKRTLDVPGLKQLGSQHTSANVLTVSSAASKLNPWRYATWGTCHQATNVTLLNGGISSTILNFGPSWDMFVTTAVYGNYGGQLGNRVLSGVNANRNYYEERRR